MAKSIMQDKTRHECWLCAHQLGNWWEQRDLEEHHVFDGPNRHLSEHYGLKVYLCIYHHRIGDQAVHNNIEQMRYIQEAGQEAFEKKYPNLSFREIFGRNYKDAAV